MPSKLLVNEVFGPTFQGEGPSLGTPCAFLRVAACNQHCVWCDTFYTWDFTRVNREDEVHPMTPEEVVEKLTPHLPPAKEPLVVISGGEPMLQQGMLVKVMDLLPDCKWEVETAGTIAPEYEFESFAPAFNVSLKLEHSGNERELRYRPDVINAFQDTGLVQAWKFVAQKPEDLVEVDELVERHDLFPVFIMPEGVTKEDLELHGKALVESVIERGWRMTPRLHIQMWGNERGH